MQKTVFLQKFSIIFILIFGIFCVHTVSAADAPVCPFPHKIEATADEILAKVTECQTARANNTTATITEYLCPAGDFTIGDNQPITPERLSRNIMTNILMNEADKKMTEYMRSLQGLRSKDVTAWTKEYMSCISPDVKDNLTTFYNQICEFSFVSNFLNDNSEKKTIITTTEAYPDQTCVKLAQQNIKKWQNMGANLATAAMYKSYENDRDRFVESVQGKYRSIIEKFHNYQKIIFRASSKIKTYIREAVKG